MPRYALLPLLLVSSMAFAAGHEIGDDQLGPASYPISYGTVASNGAGFLAAWRTYTFDGGSHIDGMLLDATGRRLLPAALRLVSFADDVRALQLLRFDDHYALAWTDTKPSFHIVEVDQNGTVTRTILDQPASLYSSAVVAWNGQRFLKAEISSATMIGTILDRDGAVVRSGIPLHSGYLSGYSLVTAGSDFVVVAAGDGGLFAGWISKAPPNTTHYVLNSSFRTARRCERHRIWRT